MPAWSGPDARPPASHFDRKALAISTTTTYAVAGMTCSHCVASVTEEVTAIPGVTTVEVDLASGAVTIVSESPVEETAVSRAVEEAGYELVLR